MLKNKKSLGQHWLKDQVVLSDIAECAELTQGDVVLEVGPGLGTLTSVLLRSAGEVIGVEFDKDLADKLPSQFPGKKLTVINADILSFDLDKLPKNYKVVANVPYYITSKIVEKFLTAKNKPSVMVLLVQKEVAERLAAKPGDLSVLGISAQIFSKVSLGNVVPKGLFTPTPKVDSQVVIMKLYDEPLVKYANQTDFFKVVHAGFSSKRKKIKTSLSGGLHLPKKQIEEYLTEAGIDPNTRAENLSIDDWVRLLQYVNQ